METHVAVKPPPGFIVLTYEHGTTYFISVSSIGMFYVRGSGSTVEFNFRDEKNHTALFVRETPAQIAALIKSAKGKP